MAKTPVVLLILDGWGLREDGPGNAIEMAHPKRYQELWDRHPHIAIEASGEAVGLPEGQMGNSEVGHLNMGAGRIVYQEITRINKSIRDGDFYTNPVLLAAIAHAKQNNSTLHLMGLVSDGGVHSSLDHLMSLIDLAKKNGLTQVRVHAFLDGRDVPPRSALPYLTAVEQKLADEDLPQIATVTGRYYAMDRDQRWERTQAAYDNLTLANGRRFFFSLDAVNYHYEQDINDEFVPASVTDMTFEGMQDGDSVFFFNFRPDRARQITRAFTEQAFSGFERAKVLKNLHYASMTTYDQNFDLPVAYPKQRLDRILAEVLSEKGIRQFRTAETEKYAHVTYFFNGGFEKEYAGEDRKMIPSPKVATYDEQPEMHVNLVADEIVNAVQSGQYQLVIANYANPDMIGHTGKLDAAIEAVTAVDEAIGRVADAVLATDGVLLITADHGNIEHMTDENGGEHTAHTTALVPMMLISNDPSLKLDTASPHKLSDVSPTILDLLGLEKPAQMTANSMLVRQPVSV